jgi:integrase
VPGPHLYRRPDSEVWQCDYTVKGRAFRHSTGRRDRGEALEAATEAWLEACRRARVAVPEGVEIRLSRLVSLYLADLRGRIERRELTRYEKYADHAEAHLARVTDRWQRLADIGPGWEGALAEWHADVGWRTLQITTVTARGFLRWAKEQGHLAAVPELRAPSTEESNAEAEERLPLSETQRDALLKAIKKDDPRAWRIYVILFYSAARKSDLERLVWRQVDLDGGWLRFPPRQTKSKKRDQVVGLHPKAAAALKAERRAQGKIDPAALVFGPFDFRVPFGRWLAAAGITDAHGLTAHHTARHTTATLAGEAGATLAELMALGRWSTPQIASRYMKVSARASKAALGRLR